MYMVYYTRGNVIYWSIVDDINYTNSAPISGSDKAENLHTIAERYNVNTIERID